MLSTIYIFVLYIILHIRSHLGSSTQALELQYSVSVHISISIMPPVSADSGVSTLNALCAQSQSQQPKQEHTQYRGVLRRYRDDDTHVNLPHKLTAKPCPQPRKTTTKSTTNIGCNGPWPWPFSWPQRWARSPRRLQRQRQQLQEQ